MPSESFFGSIASKPQEIKSIFVPFLANVREDFYYHFNLVDG